MKPHRSPFCSTLTSLVVVAASWSILTGHLLAIDGSKLADKNIVLFVTDDESPTLGCYGDSVAVTPNIDALAKDGTMFRQAFATTASCSASRSVILSGLHNHTNGQYGHQHHFHKFSSYHNVISLSLPQVLSRNGYRTARIGKFHVAPEKVFHFDQEFKENRRNPVLMAEKCREFVSKQDEKPFFLYFATNDPHRSGSVNRRSELDLKPNLFGNLPNKKKHFEIEEVFYDPAKVPVPAFLPDTNETREELAQYYQSVSRVDQGLGRLVKILKEAGVYDKTLIVFTSDHGMAFAGAKTNIYDAGLHVPLVVRNPYLEKRGTASDALVSHVDLTPTVVEFAGALDPDRDGPRNWLNPEIYWEKKQEDVDDNRSGGNIFRSYQGKSWLNVLADASAKHNEEIFASHTFHEIQMYYPMRSIRDHQFKLIWNIAHKLEFPFASDLWESSSWQAQYERGAAIKYGKKTVREYLQRSEFELYDVKNDPSESNNLASQTGYLQILNAYKEKLRDLQIELNDPWRSKWEHE